MTTPSTETDTQDQLRRMQARLDQLEQRVWELEIEIGGAESPAPVQATAPASAELHTDPPPADQSPAAVPPIDELAGADAATDDLPENGIVEHAEGAPADEGPVQLFEVVEVDARISGETDEGVDYVWKVTVQNLVEQKLRMQARIHFVDAHSLLVDEAVVRGLALYAGKRQVFSGKIHLDGDKAADVAGVKAHIEVDS